MGEEALVYLLNADFLEGCLEDLEVVDVFMLKFRTKLHSLEGNTACVSEYGRVEGKEGKIEHRG